MKDAPPPTTSLSCLYTKIVNKFQISTGLTNKLFASGLFWLKKSHNDTFCCATVCSYSVSAIINRHRTPLYITAELIYIFLKDLIFYWQYRPEIIGYSIILLYASRFFPRKIIPSLRQSCKPGPVLLRIITGVPPLGFRKIQSSGEFHMSC